MRTKFIIFSALFFSLISCAQNSAVAKVSNVEKVKKTVRKADIEAKIGFLASDELRGRETGSPEIDIAAAYLSNTLHSYGVKPANKGSFYQNVALEKITAPSKMNIALNSVNYKKIMALKGSNTAFTGPIIYLNYGAEVDYKNKNVDGKIVIVKVGFEGDSDAMAAARQRNKKREIAFKNGAAGLIELSTLNDQLWERFSHFFNSDKIGLVETKTKDSKFHVWIQDTNGSIANSFTAGESIKSDIQISGIKNVEVKAKNVVGMLEGTDPKLKDEFVIYSAHYDHVGIGKPNAEKDSIYNGARDNAVGTVTVLSAAQNIAKYPTKRSSLFILFTGEEKGLLGSKWYVENPVIPLEKMVYCFNSDNGGYNDTTKATIIGLNRTTVAKHIIDGAAAFGLTAIDDPAGEQGLFDRSDNVNFAAKGIPAPTYSMGFTAFDAEINKYYHQASDNPDTLDYEYLLRFFRSYVLTCRLIANDEETPFWTKGDKYYEAGTNLYGTKTIKN